MAQGKLPDRLAAAEGKGAFPDDIASLIAQQAPETTETTVDEEIVSLRDTLRKDMPRSPVECVLSIADM